MRRILCKRCGKRKNETSFYKRADGRIQTWCKDCRAAYREEKQRDPIEHAKQLERERQYHIAHREEENRKSRERYFDPNFRERILIRRRQYDRMQWHNNAEVRERKRVQKLASLARLKDSPGFKYRRKWWAFNHNHRNRIRMYRDPFPFEYVSFEAWDKLNKDWTGLCPSCKREGTRITIDHVIPISNGGYHVDENLQGLCQTCNTKKRRTETDFRK